jgi:heptosyltransferase-1
MKVLVIKTSSLGDVLHTLPALSDALRALPGARFDWVVEESFAEIPAWHPAVDTVIPVALRRWRGAPFNALRSDEWSRFRQRLRAEKYDKIVDAQGLLKSAVLTRLARGERHGLDFSSARESWAALAYQQCYPIPKGQHAIVRVRQLFAAALNYSMPDTAPEYGINREQFSQYSADRDYLVFLHGSTWASKRWPLEYWIELAELADRADLAVYLPWGNVSEKNNAQTICAASPNAKLLPKAGLQEMATVLASARAVVGVDSGLAHLAAALGVPAVTLYGATNPDLTGTRGARQAQLRAEFVCAPCLSRHCTYREPSIVKPACYASIRPKQVWQTVESQIA